MAVTPNPSGVSVSGLSASDPVNLLQVTIRRTVPTMFVRLLGTSFTTITASGTAAIASVNSPMPMIITHPSASNVLSMNGSTKIKICGGPAESIQINSSNASAYIGAGTVDLSRAGPNDNGQCTTGSGGDFGVLGGATTQPAAVSLGTTGHYISPSSPVQDPLASVYPGGPPVPSTTCSTSTCTSSAANGTMGCTNSSGCTVYSPGNWNSGGISVKNSNAIFKPGLYYINGGGFSLKNSTVNMCPPSSCPADPNTDNGMVVYNTGPLIASGTNKGFNNAGTFDINTGVYATLLGGGISTSGAGAPSAPYYGILFFQDRNSVTQSHGFGQGNGCFSLIGTVYVTNTLSVMQADPTHFQSISYNGNPCSGTIQQGEIITGKLSLVGTTAIAMNLFPGAFLKVRKVALVQ